MLKRSEGSSSTMSSVCAVWTALAAECVGMSPFAMSLLHGEVEQHGGAVAFAAQHLDRATVLLHDGLRDRESEPGALRLGREERMEQLRQHAARHARAVVGDAHLLERH